MQGNQVGFESSLQQHLDTEQRRAVLEAIGGSINPDSTLGEIIDAAEALGWSEKMGDLSLADLAEALLAPNGESATAASEAAAEDDAADDEDEDDEGEDADDEDEDDDFELEIEEPAPSRRKVSKAAAAKEAKGAAAKKKIAAASKKVASKKAADAEPMKASKKSAKKAAAKPGKKEAPPPARSGRGAEKAASPVTSKKTSKKAAAAGRRKPTAVDVDDRMSLDEAAEYFLPVVEELGEATMQALEEQTGVSRRKLRFHVGQLVKHGYLERHGMGRGTYYTRR